MADPTLPAGISWRGDEIRYDDHAQARVSADVFLARSGAWKWAAEVQPYAVTFDASGNSGDGLGPPRAAAGWRRTEADARGDCERWIGMAWCVALGLEHGSKLKRLEAEIVGAPHAHP